MKLSLLILLGFQTYLFAGLEEDFKKYKYEFRNQTKKATLKYKVSSDFAEIERFKFSNMKKNKINSSLNIISQKQDEVIFSVTYTKMKNKKEYKPDGCYFFKKKENEFIFDRYLGECH